jgi:hypothetical protein
VLPGSGPAQGQQTCKEESRCRHRITSFQKRACVLRRRPVRVADECISARCQYYRH